MITKISQDAMIVRLLPERRAWRELHYENLKYNVEALKSLLPKDCEFMAVVKANAYGHGAVQVAKTALNSGAEYLGVATVDEAIALREAYVNAPVLVLGEPPASAIPLLLAYKIMPSIYTAEFAIRYAEAADAFGLAAPFHLKVNSRGRSRSTARWTCRARSRTSPRPTAPAPSTSTAR